MISIYHKIVVLTIIVIVDSMMFTSVCSLQLLTTTQIPKRAYLFLMYNRLPNGHPTVDICITHDRGRILTDVSVQSLDFIQLHIQNFHDIQTHTLHHPR